MEGEGEGEGEAWPPELWEGLDLLWLVLFGSSGLSGTGDGLRWTDAGGLLRDSAFSVAAFNVSTTTDGGDERSEAAFKFGASPSEAAAAASLSAGSTFPLAVWMLSTSPGMGSGW